MVRNTSMYTEADGLTAIVRYYLKHDPYDGSVYVSQDGQGFLQGKHRAEHVPGQRDRQGKYWKSARKNFSIF